MSACIRCGPEPSLEPEGDFRRAWRQHPNYPDQMLLVGGHDTFRRLSREVVALCEARGPRWQARCELVFRLWHRAMGSHEAYEEHKLYPFLARRYATSMAALEGDHRELNARRDDVLAALERGSGAPEDVGMGDEVEARLVAYDAELRAHLDREEAVVIPLLLDLPRAEFVHFTHSPIDRLLAELPACQSD